MKSGFQGQVHWEMHTQSQDLPAEQKVSEKLRETRSWSDRLKFQQKTWEFFYPVSCLNSGWSCFVLPPGHDGIPHQKFPTKRVMAGRGFGRISTNYIDITYAEDTSHVFPLWSSRYLKTFCRVNNILDVEGSKRSNLVSNGKLPDIMVLEEPWTSNNNFAGNFCHLQLAFVPIGKHLSPKAEHRHEFYCKFLWTCSVEVMHWRSAWEDNFGTLPVQLQQWHPRAIGNTVLVPKEAKLPLHNGWRRTRRICHWPSNVKSTIRKAKPDKHNTKLDCIRNTGLYLQLCSFTACHCTISCTTALGNNDLRRGHSALVEVFAATSPECDPAAPTSNPLHNFIRLHYSKAFWEYLDFMKRLHDASVRWGQPHKSCSAPLIVGLLECSFLSANTTDLKFRCCPIFQWLCIQGNEPCLWHHGRLQKLLRHKQKSQGLWADKADKAFSSSVHQLLFQAIQRSSTGKQCKPTFYSATFSGVLQALGLNRFSSSTCQLA